jgi:hypothetical protein
VIVIEGPDGAGKSTFVSLLAEELGLPIADRSMKGDLTPLKKMDEWINWCISSGWQPMIFDRFALVSGPLYAPIMNDPYQLGIYSDLSWMLEMERRFYTEVEPLMIYCLPPLEVVKENLLGDKENAAVADHIDRIYQAYVARAALDYGTRYFFIYDYTQGHSDRMVQIVAHHVAQVRRRKGL